MLIDYSDITKRLGPPLWYDGNGVPRYDRFTPDIAGVYMDYVALIKIQCQACKREFLVSVSAERYNHPIVMPSRSRDYWSQIGSFHYGDPPHHACTGDAMNSMPVEILEFWGWPTLTRFTELEFELSPYQEEELYGKEP